MDVVTLALAQAAVRDSAKSEAWRRLTTGPGWDAVPLDMAVPYTVDVDAVAAAGQTVPASAITDADHVFPTSPAVTLHGSMIVVGPLVGGSVQSVQAYGASTGPQQSQSPFTCTTVLDTLDGAFDIVTRDLAATEVRITVDGEYVAREGHKAPGTGAGAVIIAVTGLDPGSHRLDVEFGAGTVFGGFNIGPNDSLSPVGLTPPRVMVVGDSFTEPTVNDEAANYFRWGAPQMLGRMLGCEVMSCGSGGTGYVDPGANGRVPVAERVEVDVLPAEPDVVIWSAGLNDWGAEIPPAEVTAAVQSCIEQVRAALPACLQVVTSPLIASGTIVYPHGLYKIRDAVQAAAAAESAPYVDLMELPPVNLPQPAGVLAASVADNASTISSSVSFRSGSLIRIGDTDNTPEIRQVSAVSGSGPYTITLANPVQSPYDAAEPVVESGPGWCTGSGDQGTPQPTGTSSRYCGPDGSHPTSDLPGSGGHPALARALYDGLVRVALAET